MQSLFFKERAEAQTRCRCCALQPLLQCIREVTPLC